MDPDQLVRLTQVVVSLVQALAWPLLVMFVVVYLGTPLKKFLGDIGEFTFKAGATGLEATAKRQQIEAAAALGAASARKIDQPDSEKKFPNEDGTRQIAYVVSEAVKATSGRRLAEASVLWVDDNPANNVYERKALEAFGIRFTLSTSTEDALEKIRLNKYDVIISDMGRGLNTQAGYELLEEKQKLGDKSPFIIYAGSDLPEHKAEARRRGAYGSTNNPKELFQLVTSAIQMG